MPSIVDSVFEESLVNDFYQPVAREASGRLVLRLLCVFRVCWYIYAFIYLFVHLHLSRAQ